MTAVGYAGNPNPIEYSVDALYVMLFLAVISAIAFTLWYLLIKNNDIATISLFKFTIPIFGSLLSILVLPDEHFTLIIIPSLILIATGIIIFTRSSYNEGKLVNSK